MSEETKAAFGSMKFYKFYPVKTPDSPDISNVKVNLTFVVFFSGCFRYNFALY